MNNISNSKKIFKTEDDTCKKFSAECLQGDPIHAIDIDTLYYVNGVWYIFEYLKCDSEFVNPYTSDPSKYVYNWKKFYTLWQITNHLHGKLFLVNYADKEEYKDMVRVMQVKEMDYDLLKLFSQMSYYQLKTFRKPYMKYAEDLKMSKEEFSVWLRDINDRASLKEVLPFKDN